MSIVKPTIEKVTWSEVRKDVAKVNLDFAAAVDAVSPPDSFALYRIRYPFGAMIFDTATLNLPNADGRLVPLTHHTISSELREQLSYRPIPIGLMLHNGSEVHVEMEERIVPLTVLSEGTPFGLWEALDPAYSYFVRLSWNVSSGARSLFMLPKITEVSGYKRLRKEFGVRVNAPKDIWQHWNVFKEIINSNNFPKNWFSEILLFPKQWFDAVQTEEFVELRDYFFKAVWNQSMFWRFAVTFDLVWQKFAFIVKRDNIRCGSYQLGTLKHLIALIAGALPSFTASSLSEKLAPTDALQEIFLSYYGLNYVPTILQPHHFGKDRETVTTYYSLNEPTLIESVPKTREILSVMQAAKEVKDLYDDFCREADEGSLGIENTPIYDLLQRVNVDFFHTLYDPKLALKSSTLLPKQDTFLLEMPKKRGARGFCNSSPFLRGLIRLAFSKPSK